MADSNQQPQGEAKRASVKIAGRIILTVIVAVIIFLLARSCSSNRQQLEKTKLCMLRERDSLSAVIRNVQDKMTSVESEREKLLRELAQALEEKRKLDILLGKTGRKMTESDARLREQNRKLDLLSEKNDSLTAALNDLQIRITGLNAMLAARDAGIDTGNKSIDSLTNIIKLREDSLQATTTLMQEQHLTDSMKVVPRFVTSGGLDGGFGINYNNVPYSKQFIGASVLFGMEFNRRFLGGIGTGAHIFNGGTLMPIFLEFRYGFPRQKNTPYIFSRGGPLINFNSYSESNLFLNAGIGLRNQLSENLAFNFATGIYSHNSGISGRDSFISVNLGLIYESKGKQGKK